MLLDFLDGLLSVVMNTNLSQESNTSREEDLHPVKVTETLHDSFNKPTDDQPELVQDLCTKNTKHFTKNTITLLVFTR